MLRGIRYVIFDLNGTLVIGSYPSWREVLETKLGLERKGKEMLSLERLRFMAKGVQSFEEILLRLYGVENPGEVKGRAFELYTSGIRLRENILEVLQKLGKKYRLILCSDTTGVAKGIVKKFKIKKYFTKLFYSCDMGSLKSERKFWTEVLANFPSSEPSEFLVIGDSPRSDVYWPKKLGMHTILIRSAISSPDDYVEKPTGSIGEEPEYAIETLKNLLNYLGE
jgi:FMN phosphatase YigB (HAD superfamily)